MGESLPVEIKSCLKIVNQGKEGEIWKNAVTEQFSFYARLQMYPKKNKKNKLI